MSGRRGTLPASTFGGGSPVASLMVPPLSVPGFVTSSPPPSAAGSEFPAEPDHPPPPEQDRPPGGRPLHPPRPPGPPPGECAVRGQELPRHECRQVPVGSLH